MTLESAQGGCLKSTSLLNWTLPPKPPVEYYLKHLQLEKVMSAMKVYEMLEVLAKGHLDVLMLKGQTET